MMANEKLIYIRMQPSWKGSQESSEKTFIFMLGAELLNEYGVKSAEQATTTEIRHHATNATGKLVGFHVKRQNRLADVAIVPCLICAGNDLWCK